MNKPSTDHLQMTRAQLLLTSLICLSTPIFLLIPDFPYHVGFVKWATVSGIVHLFLYIFFDHFAKAQTLTFTCVSAWNNFVLGFVIHYSGGIVSPFVFLYVSILISDALYGVDYPLAITFSIGSYLTVVLTEYFGILPSIPVTSHLIYWNKFAMLFTTGVIVVFIAFGGLGIKQIMKRLRTTIEVEHERQQQIRAQLLKLEAPSQIGLLVNKIVHDLRGPLGAIGGFITVLKRENDLTEESKEDCDVMSNELTRIQKMIDRMIVYSRPIHSGREIQCPVDLMETVLTVFSFYPGAKNVLFTRDFPPPHTLTFMANKEGLQQVFFNLFKNAVEAISDLESVRPKISVKIHQENNSVYIQVDDNGPGIDQNILTRLGKGATSTKKEGGGVGLLISKEIVESHGGKFNIHSEMGTGTRVVTSFPLYVTQTQ